MTAIVRVLLRYAQLLAARSLGWLRRTLLGSLWRPLTVLVLLTMVVRYRVDRTSFNPDEGGLAADHILRSDWLRADRVVLVIAFLGLARWVLNARKRLVIGTFVDYTGDEPKALPGLSSLLQAQLARLYDLVDTVDQSRAVPEVLQGPQSVSFDEQLTLEEADDDDDTIITFQPLLSPAPLTAQDLTDVLDAAVSVEATMSMGPVKIPIGALAGLLGRLAQGPRVSGSVHRTEQGLVLTARTLGSSTAKTWRVDGPPAGRAGTAGTGPGPEALLDELAVRIFTDMAMEGSVKWHATWAYLNGLRAYRGCLRTKKDRRIGLERAKDHFIETIVEDNRFDLAHYNLGVVATELNQREAAETAFLAAIRLNKDRWAPSRSSAGWPPPPRPVPA